MTEKISVGIDVGTNTIKVVVASAVSNEHKIKPKIIGIGYAETKGLRHGYIQNSDEVRRSLRQAITGAERTSGYKISKAYLAVGGIGLESAIFSTTLALSEKSGEVATSDINRILEKCESELPESFTLNKEILHVIPLEYKVDGKVVLGRPQGVRGEKLEAKVLFITSLTHHLKDLIDAIDSLEIDIEDVMAAPLSTSLIALQKSQQVAGCILVNIGAETTTAAVFENGTPISLEVFPIGGRDITNDLALGLKISIEDAERIKLSKPESVPYPRKKLEEIINARVSDIFEYVESHLKKIGRNGLLPAGIIITGGGASTLRIEEIAKNYLKLPAKKVAMKFDGETKLAMHIKDGSWAVAYGLCVLGISSNDRNSPGGSLGSKFGSHVNLSLKNLFKKIGSLLKKILP